MKASARNQWEGQVSTVEVGAVNAEVSLALRGGTTLIASITRDSVSSLGLEKGKSVLALVKAPHIIVVTDDEGYSLSTRNQLTGTIRSLEKGPITTEVVIELSGGDVVVATITSDSSTTLGLTVGKSATAAFKASAVIIAAKA